MDPKDATTAATQKLRDLGSFIREQRKSAQKSLRHLASEAGVSNPYLSQIERGLRKPSAEILQSIAKALRISAETLYVKAGILEERTDDLADRIMADAVLSERQKQFLVQLYHSFRQVAEDHGDQQGDDTADAVMAVVTQELATQGRPAPDEGAGATE
jgi:transcriptional regulator with XRE-family HTH domain